MFLGTLEIGLMVLSLPTNLSTMALVALGVSLLAVLAWLLVFKKRPKTKPSHFKDPHEVLKQALSSSQTSMLRRLLSLHERLDDEFFSAIEQILIEADVGFEVTEKLVNGLKADYQAGKISRKSEIVENLKNQLKASLGGAAPKLNKAESGPTVILMVGVNGVGKTTSISKLAKFLAGEDKNRKKVLLSASDTFRAAAVEQLALWADRLDIDIVKGQEGQKPDAVAHDAAEKGKAKAYDYIIVDTAGRLHTDKNLMQELAKISRVLGNAIDGAPHETILVVDANNGQNALIQTEKFKEFADITGLFLTKMDGTPKGGIVVQIKDKLSVPVKFVGLGEQPDHIAAFKADEFVDALFGID